MRGCVPLVLWTAFSLMTAGGLLGQQLYEHYPYSPEPSTLLTREEALAYSVFAVFWLAGIALMVTLGWLWRAAHDDSDSGGRQAIVVAVAWGLIVSWVTAGIKPLLFPEAAHYWDAWDAPLWTWTVSSPLELVFLPSFAVLLWCGGLAAMLTTARGLWRWLAAQEARYQ